MSQKYEQFRLVGPFLTSCLTRAPLLTQLFNSALDLRRAALSLAMTRPD